MRRAAFAGLLFAVAFGLAGCGSRGTIQARPERVQGTVAEATSTSSSPGQTGGGVVATTGGETGTNNGGPVNGVTGGTQTTGGAMGGGGSANGGDAAKLKGSPAAGKGIFASNGCGSCHTLKAANAVGKVGPNLDQAKPSYQLAVMRVTNGKGVMPSFKNTLKPQQIADVASYVVKSTGGKTP